MLADNDPLVATLTQLRTDWPIRAWSWDDRLGTVTSAVSGADIDKALAITARVLPRQLDGATLGNAPPEVLAVIDQSGGLRGKQLAFCAGTAAQWAFALWWPWGSGTTVSLRIGLVGADEDEALASQLRALFDVK